MAANSANYWKRLWRWTTSNNLSLEELRAVLGSKEVTEALYQGLNSYKPNKPEAFSQLQSKYPDQTKLLSVVQTLQSYINVDTFQVWDIIKHYLCDISYGTPDNALKNVAFVDTRTSFLLPNIWRFYYSERLFMLKLLQYIIENHNNKSHKYHEEFSRIYNNGCKNLLPSLITQFEKAISTVPPPRKIQSDFSNDSIRQEWAEYNLREQLFILQVILLLVEEQKITDTDFQALFKIFRKHNYGKNQGYQEMLEERHREMCMRITYMEVCLFIVINYKNHANASSWIQANENVVEPELTKLQLNAEHSAMLLSWMLLSLQGKDHAVMFESKYQHYGATALKMHVFEFLSQMLNSSVFTDKSKCSQIARQTVYNLLKTLCDKFDGDGTISHQAGITQLCADLLRSPEIAEDFWKLQQKDDQFGIVSLWNTALEYFPYNFSMLSVLAAGLAQAGKCSVLNLIGELKNLPVYTEIYNPNSVPLVSFDSDDATIGREYFPLGGPSYRIEAGSKATVMERKEGTMIHFRTPYSYWTVFNSEIEKALDRKQHHNVLSALQRVYEGAKVLKGILKALVADKEIPKSLVAPSEGVFDVLVRFMRADATALPLLVQCLEVCAVLVPVFPKEIHLSEGVFDVLVRFMRADAAALPLLVQCLEVCAVLVPVFPKEIHLRLVNTGLLPRARSLQLSAAEYARGASFDSGAVGSFLVAVEQPGGSYHLLGAYIDLLCAFHESSTDERITMEIILPGLVLIVREVFPNMLGWRYASLAQRRELTGACLRLLALVLQKKTGGERATILRRTGLHSLHDADNARQLLHCLAVGNENLEKIMLDETNWISGPGNEYITSLQRCVAIIMFALRLKEEIGSPSEMTPLEHLIFAQNKQKDRLKVVPKVTSYINHAFNRSLPVLSCRLLKRFADGFQMSLFASLDMTAYQVRVMFLDRLRDEHESLELKVAILEFVATCIGKQPGLTEAFFMMNHEKAKAEENDKEGKDQKKAEVEKKTAPETDDSFEGILGYMADYLSTIKTDAKYLHSPLLGCIMALFHALWKNNMQILVKKLRENKNFWEHLTSPLFNEIQPGLRTYAQIFNVLGIELFASREKLEPNLKAVLEQFFDTDKKHLDTWVDFVYSFDGKDEEVEVVDKVPVWLGLLTSWKDFTTIFCKCLPISLNIAHKSKMVAPCMNALLNELDDLKDGRLVVILAELYVIMLANWKDDCFENRKANAKQIDNLLTNTAAVYECLHPRAIRAILSICTVAISSLDYEIKANSATAQSIIRSVTNINSLELQKLLDDITDVPKAEPKSDSTKTSEEIPPVVLCLAMLEQCLDLYDEMFSGLSQWFQSSKFINKLLCCLQTCLQSRRHYHTSLAALRCITAYSRGPFSKDLLMSDVDQFLWLQLLPPKIDSNGGSSTWKPQEWWRVYAYSLDFISMMVMKHGQFFASDAITFVGVHLEHLIEAILLPRQVFSLDALNLCASTLNLVVQLVKFESRWRIQNINSLIGIMRSISACLYQCVTLMLRARRPADAPPHDEHAPAPAMLHRTLEILHMATLCLLSFSPDLLSLLADPGLDMERWQPLVELHFGAPKISYEPFPQLTFGTLLSAICLLTRSLNHAYHADEGSGSRSPRGRRRACSCGSPGESRRANRSESLTSISSAASALPWLDERLVAGALEATATLLAEQSLTSISSAASALPWLDERLVAGALETTATLLAEQSLTSISSAASALPWLDERLVAGALEATATLLADGCEAPLPCPGCDVSKRSQSLTSISSAASALPWLDERLVAGALEATATLLAEQALLAVRDASVPSRHKQLVRRELSSELTVFHDFVRKRILCAAHSRPHLVRSHLGAWPLPANEEETKRIEEARKDKNLCLCDDESETPPPPPPKRAAHDSMREYILRKHYLNKCAQTPTKGPPSPVSHSTPASDKKKETSRSSKRVSWAETTRDSDESLDSSLQEIEPVYSNLTDVQINNDEDYFHFMSIVFLYICQTDL
ncbi:nucleoporin Nup188 [Ostrinia nubilalis]|uniref:nucleoporin Nup188 n=1 Tax=Ostrinia nubilalis TaxID=29057 RepID=UPI00308260FC